WGAPGRRPPATRKEVTMSGSCERCGAPATRVETATHLFCTSCQQLASTGARPSSELLFTVEAEPERTTREDLASLTRPAVERASISPLLAYGPAMLAPPRPRAHRAPSLLAGGAAVDRKSVV